MRQGLVAGNWKMNGRGADTRALVFRIREALSDGLGIHVVLCPPFVYLSETAKHLGGTDISLGAQNLCEQSDGAFTGEVSAEMLADVGCTFVIVGHSERRILYSESNRAVAEKYQRALDVGLTPILCVGETLDQREAGMTSDVVRQQLAMVIDHCGAEVVGAGIIAYEPVWAIGTGRTATPDQAQEVHAFIRSQLAEAGGSPALTVRVLYGGSVNADNAERIFSMPDVDGGLIGGASLDADAFVRICNSRIGSEACTKSC